MPCPYTKSKLQELYDLHGSARLAAEAEGVYPWCKMSSWMSKFGVKRRIGRPVTEGSGHNLPDPISKCTHSSKYDYGFEVGDDTHVEVCVNCGAIFRKPTTKRDIPKVEP